MDISLISLGKEVECYLCFPKRVEANFFQYYRSEFYFVSIKKEKEKKK